MRDSIPEIIRGFEQLGYILDHALATAVYLLIQLGKPLLIEGHAGVGKTEVAKVLAAFLGTELIRLQCYEGLERQFRRVRVELPEAVTRDQDPGEIA